jgi:hypothetical protein
MVTGKGGKGARCGLLIRRVSRSFSSRRLVLKDALPHVASRCVCFFRLCSSCVVFAMLRMRPIFLEVVGRLDRLDICSSIVANTPQNV